MAANPNSYYLVDGSGYIFRAYYAVPPLTTKNGFPTNALFGFTKMLLKLLGDCSAKRIAVVFDAGAKTFRNDIYSDYKANRKECPEDLKEQMPFFRAIAAALGCPVLELPGFEADDVIATVCTSLTSVNESVVVVSADKDLLQLVSDKIQVWDTMRDRWFDASAVKEKLGVLPDKVVDLLALMGDQSDNVPGLSGCGPKTALQLIEKFGTIEAVLSSTEQLKSEPSIRNRAKLAQAIELEAENVRLSRRLVEVEKKAPVLLAVPHLEEKTNRPVMISQASSEDLCRALSRRPIDGAILGALGEKLEFSFLLEGVINSESSNAEEPGSYKVSVVYEEDFEAFAQLLAVQPSFAFDTETSSLDFLSAQLVGASFCFSDSEAFYMPIGHAASALPEHARQVTIDRFREFIGPILESKEIKKIGQNLKFDISVLSRHGINLRGVGLDTMVAAWLLAPDKGQYNLTVLAREFLGLSTIEFDEALSGAASFAEVDIERASRYAGQDAYFAWRLGVVLGQKLTEANLMKVLDQLDAPLVEVLSLMECNGVKLDVELLKGMSISCASEITRLEEKIFELAGTKFNVNSPKQLSEILFSKLSISTKGLKKTKTGISTDSTVLEKLLPLHPIAGVLLEYRFLHKLKSTYIDSLPDQVSKVTGRIHSRFNQTSTATGRLSSSDPNLQNIPLSLVGDHTVRAAFIAEQDNVLVSADYSQIELRLLAHMSGDDNLIAAFRDGIDIHKKTAREIHGLGATEDPTSDQRRVGKTINFGVIYGMGPFRLARDLGISTATASEYIESYFKRYPGVRELFSKLEIEGATQGYVSTIFGRKRFIADLNMDGRDEGFRARAAINAPIQGSAADLIKLAMINLQELIRNHLLPARMVLQIHDELVFECKSSDSETVSQIVRETMENVIKLRVPLVVDVGSGVNWQEAH